MKKTTLITAACIAISLPSAAEAGRSCTEREISATELQKASSAALKTLTYLQNTDARMAFVGRVGSDLSKYDLKYSHMGIALRDHTKGKWTVTHELNTCGASTSDIYDEGLVNFYLDDPHSYDTLIAIPSPEVQSNVITFLQQGGADYVHNPQYSMISNPFDTKYQNSNGFVLATIVGAKNPAAKTHIKHVTNSLQKSGYSPTTIRVGLLKRLGASIFKANVAFDDHEGKDVNFVSVKSIVEYLHKHDPQLTTKEL